MPLTKSTKAGEACVDRNATLIGFFCGFCSAYQINPVTHS
jgi:hypothetical protein